MPAVEANSSIAEAASECLENLLEVFGLLITLRKEAQEHDAEMNLYAEVAHSPLLRDPSDPDTLMDIAESKSFLPFVFNATMVFAVTILDDLLKSLEGVLKKNGNQELVTKANAIIQECCTSQGKNGSTRIGLVFRRRYVFVSLCLGLMEYEEAKDALRQRTKKPILDKRFAVLELYRKRCVVAHDDPFADMSNNPVDDYVSAYRLVQRLAKKWNASFPPALNHESTTGAS